MKNAIFVLATVGLLTGEARPADACRCRRPTFKRERRQATHIFVGTVAKLKRGPTWQQATFAVERAWKGKVRAQQVTWIRKLGRCTPRVSVGERWLVYGYRKGGKIHLTYCSRSSQALNQAAQRDLKRLGAGRRVGRRLQLVRISASRARIRKLLPAEISFELTGLAYSVSRFPSAGVYVHLSGPPGGPLGLRITSYKGLRASGGSARKLVTQRIQNRTRLGRASRVKVAGTLRWAAPYQAGQSLAAVTGCLVMVDKKSTRQGLVLDVYRAAGRSRRPKPCKRLLKSKSFAKIIRTLQVKFP